MRRMWHKVNFLKTGRHTNVKEISLPYYSLITEERIVRFIPFLRVLELCEMQTAWSRTWTQFAESISNHGKHYTIGTSKRRVCIYPTFLPRTECGKSIFRWSTAGFNSKFSFSKLKNPICWGKEKRIAKKTFCYSDFFENHENIARSKIIINILQQLMEFLERHELPYPPSNGLNSTTTVLL